MSDEYRLMQPPPTESVADCPCCGDDAQVWEFIESPDSSVMRVVMCNNNSDIGPRDSAMYNGCLLSMPPNDFYRGTGRDAVRYWNEFAAALTALQRTNRWKSAQVLRNSDAAIKEQSND